jgi:hypothetical protein
MFRSVQCRQALLQDLPGGVAAPAVLKPGKKRFPFFHFGDKMNWGRLNCLKSAGPSCLKVVAKDIGGTTDIEVHCSGSCPTCKALVAKWSSFLR